MSLKGREGTFPEIHCTMSRPISKNAMYHIYHMYFTKYITYIIYYMYFISYIVFEKIFYETQNIFHPLNIATFEQPYLTGYFFRGQTVL